MFTRSILALGFSIGLCAQASGATPYAYVINGVGETLSKINLQTKVVTNNIVPLGSDVFSFPNQILVRDTLAYVVCSGTNEIQRINLKTETTAGYILLPVGFNPFQMVFYDTQYAFVTNLFDNSVSTINLITNGVVDTDSVGVSPEGIGIHDGKVWVVCTNYDYTNFLTNDGAVVVFSPLTDSVYATIPVGHNPQYITFDREHRAHVICTGDYGSITGMAYRIDANNYAIIDSIPLGGQPADVSISGDNLAFVAAGGWVTNGNLYSYDATSGTVAHDASNPLTVALGCVSARAYQDGSIFAVTFDDRIDRIDSAGGSINSYVVGDGPGGIDFNYMPSDVNGDFSVNILDVNVLVSWLFAGGVEPPEPHWRANVNSDFSYNILDVTYMVSYLFAGGPKPKPPVMWRL